MDQTTRQHADQLDQSLGITLDPRASTPIYRQIADQLAHRITTGALGAGYQLPPSRTLAAALDTHRNTVVRAFEELTREGLITARVGRGSFVLERPSPAPPEDTPTVDEAAAPGVLPWARLLSRAVQSEPLRRMQRLSSGALYGDVINLARMQASKDLLPHHELRSCIDHVMATLGPETLEYAPSQGVERLRVLIAQELERAGINADAGDILITSGSQQALDLIARALVDPGDIFLTEGRTYSGALNILTICGAQVVGVPGDEAGPDLDALRALARRRPKGLYLMPSSRNPTGTSISEERRQDLIRWSQDAGVPLVEDDYGADLELDPATVPLPSLRARDREVFHVSTYSKKLIPALRVGFIVCPAAMRASLTRLKHAMDLGTSTLLQHALAEFLERGLLRAHIDRVTSAYRERRDALAGALAESLPEGVTFRRPERGVVLWLSLPPELDPEIAYEAARLEGVLVSPGSVYNALAPSHGGLRLTYCGESPERLAEGGRRLGRALDRVMSHRHGARRVELMGA